MQNNKKDYYTEITDSIKVSVKPIYVEEQSSPEESHFTWAYNVYLENLGKQTVKLVNRYWRITDGRGNIKEVKGAGVVGEQPVLRPGESFEYTSGTFLPTPSGIMTGDYEMIAENGNTLKVKIPAFSLDSPDMLSKPN